MSMTKRNPEFDRHMEDLRREDENSYITYMDWRYHMDRDRIREQTTNDPQAPYTAKGAADHGPNK